MPIRVLDETFDVPEGIPLIRAFQYIQYELGRMDCDWSLYCFNDTIGCCTCGVIAPGAQAPTAGRACCVRVAEGLVVAELPEGARLVAAGDRTP
ncbi:MAG: hypothetical protein KC620_12415 [Myxococcales bacterium]|nr:hypothetical protein [Myxococcales bacterium]